MRNTTILIALLIQLFANNALGSDLPKYLNFNKVINKVYQCKYYYDANIDYKQTILNNETTIDTIAIDSTDNINDTTIYKCIAKQNIITHLNPDSIGKIRPYSYLFKKNDSCLILDSGSLNQYNLNSYGLTYFPYISYYGSPSNLLRYDIIDSIIVSNKVYHIDEMIYEIDNTSTYAIYLENYGEIYYRFYQGPLTHHMAIILQSRKVISFNSGTNDSLFVDSLFKALGSRIPNESAVKTTFISKATPQNIHKNFEYNLLGQIIFNGKSNGPIIQKLTSKQKNKLIIKLK